MTDRKHHSHREIGQHVETGAEEPVAAGVQRPEGHQDQRSGGVQVGGELVVQVPAPDSGVDGGADEMTGLVEQRVGRLRLARDRKDRDVATHRQRRRGRVSCLPYRRTTRRFAANAAARSGTVARGDRAHSRADRTFRSAAANMNVVMNEIVGSLRPAAAIRPQSAFESKATASGRSARSSPSRNGSSDMVASRTRITTRALLPVRVASAMSAARMVPAG